MSYSINTEKTVAVSPDYYWLPINKDTPKGVKIQLLGLGGVAVYGEWDGKSRFWQAWAPVPKKPDWLTCVQLMRHR